MQEVEEEKCSFEVLTLKKANKEKDELINELKKKIVGFESEKLELYDNRQTLARLYDLGLIDDQGEPIFIEHPGDREAEGKEELVKF